MADLVRCRNPAVLRGRISGITAENKEPYNFCRDHIVTYGGMGAQYYGDAIPEGKRCECGASAVSADSVVMVCGKVRRSR